MAHHTFLLPLLAILSQISFSSQVKPLQTLPPLPILPLPSFSQLKWQQREIIFFHHFGVNTFTDSEWGTGHESPEIFSPSGLNTAQWAEVAEQTGVTLMILTAKHHDGFCLWPSKYTEHSVVGSPLNDGNGDVVRDFVGAAKSRGIDAGLYLSPWDRHDRRYGNDVEYNEFYMAQLQELLNNYGSNVREIWFDGAKGSNAKNMTYYFSDWFSMVKELQSSINIFSDAGPDVRWVGNEMGQAGSTCWSAINGSSITIGTTNVGYLNTGDPKGTNWVPAECDVSIRKGWFWHKSQSPKKLNELLDVYYKSVGRNCVLLLNVPPNTTGLISESDVRTLKQFRGALDSIFAKNLAQKCSVSASSQRGGNNKESSFGPLNVLDDDHTWTYWAPSERVEGKHWIEFKAEDGGNISFNVIRVQEAIGLGQRVKKHEVFADGIRVVRATTVGYKRLHRLEMVAVNASVVRIKIVESKGIPLISSLGLYFDPFWNPRGRILSSRKVY